MEAGNALLRRNALLGRQNLGAMTLPELPRLLIQTQRDAMSWLHPFTKASDITECQRQKINLSQGQRRGYDFLHAIELGKSGGRPETLRAIQKAPEKAGVEFTNGQDIEGERRVVWRSLVPIKNAQSPGRPHRLHSMQPTNRHL